MKIFPDLPSAGLPPKTFLDWIVAFLMETALLYYVSCCLLLLGTYSIMHSQLPGSLLMGYCESYGLYLVYVAVLTVLCLLVFRRLLLMEDGLVMAGLALFLVLDPAFFNNVFYTYNLSIGLEANSFCAVLSAGVYVVLIKVGGVPWTKRFTMVTALTAGFVYYYPAGMNANLLPKATDAYFYALCWIPLLVAILCEPLTSVRPVSEPGQGEQPRTTSEIQPPGSTVLPDHMKHVFLVATTLVVFYIVLSHLIAASYAYSLEVRPEYLAPTFLAAGLLFFKLRPTLGTQGRRFLWVPAFLAGWCSCAASENPMVNIPWGITLSPFRLGFGAVAVFALHFWKKYRTRSWAVAAVICLLLVVSGTSLSDAAFNISHFRFVPWFFLAVVFALCSLFKEGPAFPTLAGGCLMVAVLSPVPAEYDDKLVIFLQLWTAWIAFIQWHFYQLTRQWSYSSAGAFILSLSAMMCYSSPHRLAWGIDYFLVITVLLLAGRFLENGFLWMLSLSGILAAPLYLARNQLLSATAELRRIVNKGLLLTIIAFLLLPLAYFLSSLKTRQRRVDEMLHK